MPDKCWHCGYDLKRLDTGVCPECGAHFVTGRDLARLHDTIVGGTQSRCATCGTERPSPDTPRCPTCGLRYAIHAPSSPARAVKVQGVAKHAAQNSPARIGRTRASGAGWAVLVTMLGLAGAVGLVLLANAIAGSYSATLLIALKVLALLLAGGMLGWLFWRLMRHDVQTLRGQLSSGPRGWSHRVVGRCPNCGYDRTGLREGTCPECGLILPPQKDAGA